MCSSIYTAMEAMHAGRPLVACQVQGLAEVVTDGVTGLLVAPDSPRALADGLARCAADPGLALDLAEQGRQEAARRFSVEGYRERMAAAVSHMLI